MKAGGGGPAQGHPLLHRGCDRLDGHRQGPALVDLRRGPDDGHGGHDGEGRLLVRQRVGLLEPRRRARDQGPRVDARAWSQEFRSVREAPAEGKRVLVRADLNVPLADGEITDDTRIRAALPTVQLLLKEDASVVLVSHLGRPESRDELSMRPVRDRLARHLSVPVELAPGVVGDEVAAEAEAARAGPGAPAREQPLGGGGDRKRPRPRRRAGRAGRPLCERCVRRRAPRARDDRGRGAPPAVRTRASCSSASSPS